LFLKANDWAAFLFQDSSILLWHIHYYSTLFNARTTTKVVIFKKQIPGASVYNFNRDYMESIPMIKYKGNDGAD